MSNNEGGNNINSKDFLIGTLVGGIVGAATALLLAPKSGKELRSDLNGQTVNLKEKGNEFAAIARQKSSDLARTVSEQSTQVAGKVRDLRDNMRKGADRTTDVSATMMESEAAQETEDFQNDITEAAEDQNTTT